MCSPSFAGVKALPKPVEAAVVVLLELVRLNAFHSEFASEQAGRERYAGEDAYVGCCRLDNTLRIGGTRTNVRHPP